MKYVKLFEQFVAEQDAKSINESYYIETWYVDKNGKEVQLLGSDGTSVFSRLPRTYDIKKHLDHINSLKKIKPFLAGGVTYKVVNRNGKVYMTGDEAQWRHQIGEHNATKGPKSINEAKGDKITIRWSGFSALGTDEGRIGTFIVSPKVHSQIEDEFGKEISIDFEDDNVNGKLATFDDILSAMKQTKYGKIAFKESFSTTKSKSINEAVLKPGRDEALANAIIAYFYAVDGTPEGDKLFSMRLNPVRSDIGTRELHKIMGWGKDAIKALSGVTRVPGDFILPNVISVASGKEFYFADNDLVGPDGKNLIMGLNKMSFRNLIDELVKQGVISAPKY